MQLQMLCSLEILRACGPGVTLNSWEDYVLPFSFCEKCFSDASSDAEPNQLI